jgi:hypothetical protein
MIGLAFDEVDEEIGILGGQGEELVEAWPPAPG